MRKIQGPPGQLGSDPPLRAVDNLAASGWAFLWGIR